MPALISARHLVDRLRHPAARADQLRELRLRLERQRVDASDEERALAAELLELRERLSRAVGSVRSCSGCAVGHPEPFGRWAGGHCCGGDTREIFSDAELASLALAGTTPGSLTPPRAELAGCVFRGPSGCSLPVRDRPNVCVSHICRELQTELAEREDRRDIAALKAELVRAFERFARLRGG
ncbi:MAG: hypothetical protein IPM35_39530 [Myxococcales bacterium]|nr:hypothetical protein [Myxococcales bacterium]